MTAANASADRSAERARPPSFVNHAAFWPFWVAVGVLLRVLFLLRVVNRPKLRTGYVIAANHSSFLDPILLGAASTRRITFLMTEVVYRSPKMHWFYRWNHAIPLATRGGNRDGLRAARTVLQQQRVVGIFPEGGLTRDGGLLLGSPGAVSLVLNEGLQIVPVGIVGASRALPLGKGLPRLCRITIRFGEPILPQQLEALSQGDRKARLQAATSYIMARIGELTGQTPRERELESAREVVSELATDAQSGG